MKKPTPPVRKEKRSTRNSAKVDSNGQRERGSSIHGLRHPKSELEAAIQRYVDLYDFAPIAYVSFDRAGRIEEANLAATALLGVPRDLLIGRPFAFYVTDLDLFLHHLLYCRTSQHQVTTELQLKPKKSEPIAAQLLSTPLTSTTRNGAVLYQTAIIDLSERRRLTMFSRWALDRDAEGNRAYVLETNNDITVRKRAEQRQAINLAVTKILAESPALTDAVPRILQIVCETLQWEIGDFWTVT